MAQDLDVLKSIAIGKEPVYAGEAIGTPEYQRKLREILAWNAYMHKSKTLRKYMLAYLKKNEPKLVADWEKYGEKHAAITVFTVAKFTTQNAPLSDEHKSWIVETVKRSIERGRTVISDEDEEEGEAKEGEATVQKLTIQDRLAMQLQGFLADIEDMEEAILTGGPTTAHQVLNYLKSNAVPQVSVPKIVAFFKPRLKELEEAQLGKCEQLTEGYSHYTKADFKRVMGFYTHLIDDCNHYNAAKKVARVVRKKKPVAKEKQVAKVKYLKQDESLKIVSINPTDIIGSSQVWVFNVKTRKLGCYKAQDHGGALAVKGTTIIGFDENASVQKTLRKPLEQLAEFKKAGKVALRTFLSDIKAVDIKLNGRLNEDVVILKAI